MSRLTRREKFVRQVAEASDAASAIYHRYWGVREKLKALAEEAEAMAAEEPNNPISGAVRDLAKRADQLLRDGQSKHIEGSNDLSRLQAWIGGAK